MVSLPAYTIVGHTVGSSYIHMVLPKETAMFFIYLGKGYTRYQLETALSLESKYAKRMYELCCQWKNKGMFSMSIIAFRKLFKIEKKFSRFSALRKEVLDLSKERLEERADVWFEYKLSKKKEKGRGRPSYDTMHFKILTKDSGLLTAPKEEKKEVWLTNFFDQWKENPTPTYALIFVTY